jgi:hypothetical protein
MVVVRVPASIMLIPSASCLESRKPAFVRWREPNRSEGGRRAPGGAKRVTGYKSDYEHFLMVRVIRQIQLRAISLSARRPSSERRDCAT